MEGQEVKKLDQPVTPKTEDQIRAELQAEYEKKADKRVTDALKRYEKKMAEKLDADRQAQEQENTAKQAEQDKEADARERDITRKSLKLVVVDALQELGLPPSLRNMIVVEDLVSLPDDKQIQKLTQRVVGVYELFKAEVQRQVQAEKKAFLRGTTPPTATTKNRSKYDEAKRDGNVSVMISEKMNAYRNRDDDY